jgi:hypothetical protein
VAHLLRGDLDIAEQELRSILRQAEPQVHLILEVASLKFLTIVSRRRGQVEEVRRNNPRVLAAAATTGRFFSAVAVARANQAWVAWREGDLRALEEHARAALDIWHQLRTVHSTDALGKTHRHVLNHCDVWSGLWGMSWLALWPLVGVALVRGQIAESVGYARQMLAPWHQRLPEALEERIEAAAAAWDAGEADTARAELDRALDLAEELRYL